MSEQLHTTTAHLDVSESQPARRGLRRRGVRAAALGSIFLAAAACSSGTETTSGASSQTPEAPATPTVTWDGTNPGEIDVPYPGRVALPDETCHVWGLDNPQPVIPKKGLLLAVIDARRSLPAQCDYLIDKGAGAYTGASYDSPKQKQSEREDDVLIKDGTVVNIIGYRIGEHACNDSGVSPVWVKFEREPGGVDSMVPVINMGGGPTLEELQAHNIPPIPSPYEGKVHANC